MTANSRDSQDSSSVDSDQTSRTDTELRTLISSLPAPRLPTDVSSQVHSRIRRRMKTVRVTYALTVLALVTTGWYLTTNENESQPLARIIDTQPPGGTMQPRDPSLEQVESLAMAYQELSSPVVHLQTIDYESAALLEFLTGLETNLENQ